MPHINQKPEVWAHISLRWVIVAPALGLSEPHFPLLCNRNKHFIHPRDGTKNGISHLAMTWPERAQVRTSTSDRVKVKATNLHKAAGEKIIRP